MSAKHTSGPWRAENSSVICPDGSIVTCCVRGSVDRQNQAEDFATARLIAAAPDLLDALRVAEESVGDLKALEIVRAAIAKATGDQS